MFSVHAAEAAAIGLPGFPSEPLATILSMVIGAVTALTTDDVSSAVERR